MKDLSRAIEECLNALELLGEPLDLANVDHAQTRNEMRTCEEEFSGNKKQSFLSTKQATDPHKVNVMKIMSILIRYYQQQRSFLASYVSCQLMKMTLRYGHSEYSGFGAAMFAAGLINEAIDMEEAHAWGNCALAMVKSYENDVLLPQLYASLHGTVLVWKVSGIWHVKSPLLLVAKLIRPPPFQPRNLYNRF